MNLFSIATFLSISVQAAALFSTNIVVDMEKANIDGTNHRTGRLVRRQRDLFNNRRGNDFNNGNGRNNGFNNGNGRNNGFDNGNGRNNGFDNGNGRNNGFDNGNGRNNGGSGNNFHGRGGRVF
ncbi:hypothetical protein DSO57_1001659 [Entomophthora muscae]|uniref:Uncharacterized protein n=1 Tax=Entomophthora muscae TaxID=34485 RepID=A0ACC2TVX3_9FUNG|nr:hypothetical protein DSO57_1001659 [Entomophthora muscae]